MFIGRAIPTSGALAGELTETEATVRVFIAAGGLAVLGLLLLLFTIWWWRGTKPEPPALAPLEVMSDRRWATAGELEQRRRIDDHRPEGAMPLNGVRVEPVPIDLSVLARDLPRGFDDLRDDVPAPLGEALDLAGASDATMGAEVPEMPDQGDDDARSPGAEPVDAVQVDDTVATPMDELMIDPLLQRAASAD